MLAIWGGILTSPPLRCHCGWNLPFPSCFSTACHSFAQHLQGLISTKCIPTSQLPMELTVSYTIPLVTSYLFLYFFGRRELACFFVSQLSWNCKIHHAFQFLSNPRSNLLASTFKRTRNLQTNSSIAMPRFDMVRIVSNLVTQKNCFLAHANM